jgi:nicotinamide-nucleotide amidase
MLIPSAQALRNSRGTAPGWWVEKGGRIIVALPGVPQELEYLWENYVAPRLKKLSHGAVVLSRTIKTFGLSEAAVAERVADLFGGENPYLGIYAKSDGIHLRIIARAATEDDAWRLVRPMEEELRRALGDVVWGVDNEVPEETAGVLLRRQRLTLATMESCTGGLLASAITDVSGSSDYFRGGIVTYATEAKVAHGVDRKLVEAHGVISAQVAEAMAQAARRELTADIGIGLTGVAGPATVEGKPVGTVFIGLAWDGGTRTISGRYPPQRHLVKRRAVTHALLELCRLLLQRDRG